MRILINLLQLQPGKPEGVATYVRELIRLLPDYMGDDELYVIHQPGLDLQGVDNNRIHAITLRRPSFVIRAFRKILTLLRVRMNIGAVSKTASIVDAYSIDIVHYPFSTIPIEDRTLNTKYVLSVMDLQHEYFPELFSTIDLRNRKELFGQSAVRANKIIAIANFTKQTIQEKLKIPGSKIETIHLAGDLSKTPKEVSNLPGEYMLFPAADWRHKNHKRLFGAIAALKAKGFKGKLVLTGFRADYATKLYEYIEELGLKDDVIDLGPVSFDELAYVFGRAKMLIYPTLFEGFGIPALEAMSIGLPVACSNTTSLPEIVGDAAETFDPESVDEIAAAIQKVWSDNDYRATLIRRGCKQAAKFSWENTAKQTYEVYRKVYGQTK